jgi:hypothetical protein
MYGHVVLVARVVNQMAPLSLCCAAQKENRITEISERVHSPRPAHQLGTALGHCRYNLYGLWSGEWVSNVRMRNIFGYLNLRSLIHADAKYDWLIDGVMSQSDGNHGLSERDAPFYLTTRQASTSLHHSTRHTD